jgi:carboxylesterase type B
MDVMVYIHGGAWLAGTGSSYQPTYLLDKDVVLVTFNYRLGPLGMKLGFCNQNVSKYKIAGNSNSSR